MTVPRFAPGALARDLLEFALPQRCPGCGVPADASRLLCDACMAGIPRLDTALCVRCLAAGREGAGCRAHPGFETRAAWIYDERAALIVHALKYEQRPGLARALGAELWAGPRLFLSSAGTLFDDQPVLVAAAVTTLVTDFMAGFAAYVARRPA